MAGWTRPMGDGDSVLGLRAGDPGACLLLYAGQLQDLVVVAKGPFIARTNEELVATMLLTAEEVRSRRHSADHRTTTLNGIAVSPDNFSSCWLR